MVAVADLIQIDGSHFSQATTTTPALIDLGASAKQATHVVFNGDVKHHYEFGDSSVVCDADDPSLPGSALDKEFARQKNRGFTHVSVRTATGAGTITGWLGRQFTPRA